jgi:hypothetical protein
VYGSLRAIAWACAAEIEEATPLSRRAAHDVAAFLAGDATATAEWQ